MCSSLQRLDLRNNSISEEENISFLGGLSDLKYLSMENNPIRKNDKYKELVNKYLPDLEEY